MEGSQQPCRGFHKEKIVNLIPMPLNSISFLLVLLLMASRCARLLWVCLLLHLRLAQSAFDGRLQTVAIEKFSFYFREFVGFNCGEFNSENLSV
jgi:hypothetical protein